MESNIKTYEDACAALQLDVNALPDVSMLPEKHRKGVTAFCKLVIITAALNQGWEPNWNDTDEYKYSTWHGIEASEEQPAGFGFSHSDYVTTLSHSHVGSRLSYRTRELALYSAKQFEAEWLDFKLLN